MIDPEKLKAALDALVKDTSLVMRPDGTTFCNVGVKRAAALFGYNGFVDDKGEPLMARKIIDYIESAGSDEWMLCEGKQASDFALRGGWGIAYMRVLEIDPVTKKLTGQRAAHDHVANVYPAQMEVSGSLKKQVPMIANVGKKNGVVKSSEAFPIVQGEALYAILVG